LRNRFLYGVALPALIASPAMAADLPVKAPPAPAPATIPVPIWTGFYIGLNAGYAWGQNSTTCSFVPGIGSPCEGIGIPGLKSSGGLFGAEIGANWQFQNWVIGAAFDWSALDLHADTLFPSVDVGKNGAVDRLASRYDWLGTARGRVGYAVGQSLFYGTGGLAFGRVKDLYGNEINGGTVGGIDGVPVTSTVGYFTTASIRTGWTAGAGWEYRLTQNWGVKLEYLHVDLGSTNLDISGSLTGGNVTSANRGSSVLHFNNAFDLVRAGVNFKW
jgi:outer membrane immunogenic protein